MNIQCELNKPFSIVQEAIAHLASSGFLFLMATLLLRAGNAQAAAVTWVGNTAGANWNTAANWSATFNSGDTPTFNEAGLAGTSLNNDIVGTTVGVMTFSANASAYTIGGNKITLGGNITASASPADQVINFDMTLNATRIFATRSSTTALTLGGVLDGTGGLTKGNNTGTLILSGNNSYSGTLTIQRGTVSVAYLGDAVNGTGTIGIGSSSAAGLTYTGSANVTLTRAVDLAGAASAVTLDVSGTGNLSFSTAFTATGSGAKTLTLQGSNTGTGTIAAAIVDSAGGATALIKTGTGTWTLSGANTYSGTTTLTAGTLNINSAGVAATSGPIGNGGIFVISTGTTIDNTSGGAITVANVNPITLSGSFAFSTASGTANNNLTLPGAMSLTGNRTITLNGTGALTLSGKLIPDDATRTLTVNNGTGVSSSTLLTIGSYDLTSAATTRTNVITGTGNITITGAVADGVAAGNGLTYNGTGTLTLSGANTYSGPTSITSGTLLLRGSNSSAGATTLSGTGVLQFDSASNGGLANGLLTLTAGSLQALTTGRSIANAVTLQAITVSGSQDLTLNGKVTGLAGGFRTLTSSMTNPKTLTLADVDINTETANARTLTIAGTGNTVITGTIANGNGTTANGLTVTSTAGTLTLSGTSTYTGAYSQTGAGSAVNLTGAMNGPASVTVNNPTASFAESAAGVIAGAATTFTLTAGSATLAGANTYGGNTTLTAGTLVLQNSGAVASSSLSLNGGALQLRSDSAQTFAASSITVGGSTTIDVNQLASGSNNALALGNVSIGGAYTLGISGGNGYSLTFGSVTIAGNATINPTTANVTLSSVTGANKSLTLGGTSSGNSCGAMTFGSGTLTKNTASTWRVSGTSTYTGATTISAGTLLFNGIVGTTAVTVNGGTLGGSGTLAGTVTVNSGASLSPGDPNVNNGVGALTINNTLTMASGSTNNFELIDQASGDTVALSTTPNLTGVHFNLYQTNGLAFGTSGTYTLITCSGTPTFSGLTVDNLPNGVTATFQEASGKLQVVLGSGGGWTGAGPDGNWSTGANWDGNVSPSDGSALIFATVGAWPINTNNNHMVTVAGITFASGGGAFTLDSSSLMNLQGDIVNSNANLQTLRMPLQLITSTRTINAYAGDITLSGVISADSATPGLTKTGANILTLSGANTYGGVTTLSAGTLSVGTMANATAASDVGSYATAGAAGLVLSGGALKYTGAGATTDRGFTFQTAPSTINISTPGATLTLGACTLNYAGQLSVTGGSGSALTLGAIALNAAPVIDVASGVTLTLGALNTTTIAMTKQGAGQLIVSAVGTRAGATTTITGGTLKVGAGGAIDALGSGPINLGPGTLWLAADTSASVSHAVTLTASATIIVDRATSSAGGMTNTLHTLSPGGNTLTIQGGSNITGGTAGLTFAGNSTLNGSPTFVLTNPTAGGTTLLTFAGIIGAGYTITLQGNGNFAHTGVYSGSGSGLILDAGFTVTATLNRPDTFTGSVTLNAGKLNINLAGVAGTSGPLGNGGTFTINGGTIDNTSGAGIILLNVNPITLGGNFAFTGALSNTHDLSFPGNVNLGGVAHTITTSGSGSTLTLGGVLSNGGFIKDGPGKLLLTGANSYSGPTTIGAGTLVIGEAGLLGSANYAGAITNNGVLLYGSTASQTLSGEITGTGALVTTNSGTLTLSGVNTYTGATTVSNGTLLVNGSLASDSAVTVAGVATLGGNGTINGPVSMNTGGTLGPGGVGAIGLLTLGNNLTNSSGFLHFELTNPLAAGTTYDQIAVAGAVILNGASVIQLNPTTGIITNGAYTLMTYGSRSGTGQFVFPDGSTNLIIGASTLTLTNGPTSLILGVSGDTVYTSLKWKGTTAIWDIGTTANWLNNGSPAIYTDGDAVTFDDTATGYTVTGTNLQPSSVFFNNATTYTVSASTNTIAGSAAVTKMGTGTLTLSGTNTFSGGLNILNGTVFGSFANSFGTGAITLGDSSGNNAATLSLTNGTVTYNNPLVVAAGSSGTLTFSKNTATMTYGGPITLNNNLTIGPSGNNSDLTFSGLITQDTGNIGSPLTITKNIGNNNLYFTGGIVIGNGGLTLDALGTDTIFINTGSITGTGSLSLTGPGKYTIASTITNSGNIIVAGSGTTAISGPNNFGNITNSGSGNVTFTSAIGSNVGAIVQNNTNSTMTMGAFAHLFTGGLFIKAGTVKNGNDQASMGPASGTVTIGDNTVGQDAIWSVANGSKTFANPITIAPGSGARILSGNYTTGGSTTLSGPVTMNNNLTIETVNSAQSGPLTLSGGITNGGATTGSLTLNANSTVSGATGGITLQTGSINHTGSIINSGTGNGTTTISANIGPNVTAVVQNSATSMLTLTGLNTYPGPTTVNAGILALGAGGSIDHSSSLTIASGATCDVSAISSYVLSTNLTVASTAVFKGGASIDFGSHLITVNYNGTQPVSVSPGTLYLNDNAFVVNGSALALDSSYVILQASGSIVSAGSYTVSGTALGGRLGLISVVSDQVILTIPSSGSVYKLR